MPRNHRILTAALALASSVGLAMTGELNPVFAISGVVMVPGYIRYIRGFGPAPRWAVSLFSVVALITMVFDSLLVSGEFFLAVAHMTIAFQAIKSFDLREAWDSLQVYFMCLLQLVITSELSVSMWVGVVFVLFLVLFLASMVLSHFVREGVLGRVGVVRPVAAISAFAVLATSLLFVSVPRVKGGVLTRKSSGGIRTVGFSENVDFGSFGQALLDQTIVMRAEISGPKLPLYWRGRSLDSFDGYSWSDTIKRRARIYRAGGVFRVHDVTSGEETEQKIVLEPLDTEVVFSLGGLSVMEAGWNLMYTDREGAVFVPKKTGARFIYTAYSTPELDTPVRDEQKYLQLPGGMEKVASLARSVAGNSSDSLSASAMLEEFLASGYEYSLETRPPPEGVLPIEHFLFGSKRGFCEHYATAMVLMLRSLGYPSRIVTGFAGGEQNEFGDYVIVRQRDAHSWVEVADRGRWVRFDPTPSSESAMSPVLALYLDSIRMKWYRYVVGFSSQDQTDMLKALSSPFRYPVGMPEFVRPAYWLPVLAIVVLAVLISLGFYARSSGRRASFETRAYLKFRKHVKGLGGKLYESSTPGEVLAEAVRAGVDPELAGDFIGNYTAVRFGGRALDEPGMRRLMRWRLRAENRK